MKRICFLINGDYHTESRAQKMCHSLSVNGYEVIVLVWDRTGKLPQIEYDGSIKIINIKVKCPRGSGIKATPKLLTIFPKYFVYLKKLSPDIIHCQNFFLWPISLFFSYLFKSKVIFDSLEPYAEQKASNFFKGSNLVKNILWFVEKRMFRKVDKRITVSEGMASRYIAGGSRDVSVVLNTPDAQFSGVRRRKENSIFTIGRIGGINASSSGVNKLIKAVRYLNDEEVQVKLVLGGPIYGGFDKDFNKLASENVDCVRYIGIVPYKKLPSILVGFDCIVASYQETPRGIKYGYAVKMFEAMAVGIPVIITNIFEGGRIIENYQCGLLLELPPTVKQIAEKIKQLVLNPTLCHKLGQNGRQAFESKFNWKVSEVTLLQTYSELLKHRKR